LISALPVEVAAENQQSTLFSMQHNAEKEFRLALDDITKPIDAGRDQGHPKHNEVYDLISHDVHSLEDLDDLLATIGTRGIDVLAGQPELPSSALEEKFEEDVEAGELDLSPNALEKTNDPVRMYLREMGTVPLLTREGEVDIAKRIERGQLSALKALSRSPFVIRQILVIGEDLKRGIRSIKEIVVFDEDEITEETLQNCVKNTTYRIDELQKHYKSANQFAGRLAIIAEKQKAREYRRCRTASVNA
jgi:RNA polymerase primary sigma factor